MAKRARRERVQDDFVPQTRKRAMGDLIPRNQIQNQYLSAIAHNHITIATGPAGTGKTFLAAVMAARALMKGDVDSIKITRPIVEASGEDLGYLPGDLNEKCDPYLRPIFDGLAHVWSQGELECKLKSKVVEISPLAYRRGRTFKNSFIIADEFQNATDEQFLMLVTRLGAGSKMVITGDPQQRDRKVTGLETAESKLASCPNVAFVRFGIEEVVRHETVQDILNLWG
jgi:phosphate starvation-inducible PhoH-like protein